ncbi:hypothetical protein [Cerasicoccus fimbriatus]|uniref:hypothetical protein n=1 Tax=Cerasicoccus fimbriatus TaxID=3014554 RepID=UPI0022B4C4E4|nr:hypothetical protein [Cerasicoccus sp. TK19100]
MLLLRKAMLLPVLGMCALGESSAAAIDISLSGNEVTVTLENQSDYYYGLQFSEALGEFETIDMALGSPAPVFVMDRAGVDADWFFRGLPISIFAPQDTDGDGMDDVYELLRPYLNPLDPADALEESPLFAGMTNLEAYILLYGLDDDLIPQFYSREVSLMNFGAPYSAYYSLSREYSLFNFGAGDLSVFSREQSIFNGGQPAIAGYPQVYSREVSLFNVNEPPFTTEALSHEVSIFNGERPAILGYPQVISREVSIYNAGAPFYSVETVSHEVSIYNDIPES